MKLNLKLTDSDWNNINYLDPRYVWHLLNMVHERYFQPGLIPYDGIHKTQIRPRLSLFSFFGPISYNEINEIYQAMIYLGNYWYLNEDKFNAEMFTNGIPKRPITFTLQDMCEIADFDFFNNPMTPGQPASYYVKFLLPMKKVLTKFKKTITNTAYGATQQELSPIRAEERCFNFSGLTSPQRLTHLRDKNNWIKICKSFYDSSLRESYLPERIYGYYSENLGIQACAYYTEDVYAYYEDYETKYQEYSGWKYTEMTFKDQEELIFERIFSVSDYLMISSYMRFQIPDTGYQKMPGIHILQVNFYMILDFLWAIYIKLNHGTIPEDGQIKELIQIPIETLVNSLTTTDDEMKDYWFQKRKRNGDYVSTTENPNHSTWYKYFSVIYRPLLVIDYSTIFKYF